MVVSDEEQCIGGILISSRISDLVIVIDQMMALVA